MCKGTHVYAGCIYNSCVCMLVTKLWKCVCLSKFWNFWFRDFLVLSARGELFLWYLWSLWTMFKVFLYLFLSWLFEDRLIWWSLCLLCLQFWLEHQDRFLKILGCYDYLGQRDFAHFLFFNFMSCLASWFFPVFAFGFLDFID